MKTSHALPVSLLLLLAVCAAQAVELPGGSSAVIRAADSTTTGTGFVLLVSGSGRQEYYLSVDALLGIQPKANGTGCTLLIQTDNAVQQTEVVTSAVEILAAVKAARPPK